jgi:hypothetical protein
MTTAAGTGLEVDDVYDSGWMRHVVIDVTRTSSATRTQTQAPLAGGVGISLTALSLG